MNLDSTASMQADWMNRGDNNPARPFTLRTSTPNCAVGCRLRANQESRADQKGIPCPNFVSTVSRSQSMITARGRGGIFRNPLGVGGLSFAPSPDLSQRERKLNAKKAVVSRPWAGVSSGNMIDEKLLGRITA